MCRIWEDKGGVSIKREPCVHMENKRMRICVLPYDGGRIVSLYDKKYGFEQIWTNQRTQNLTRYYAANYDDLSASGIEEAFPTVQPCVYEGVELPFFGEVWSAPWEYELLTFGHAVAIRLWCSSSVFPAKITKTFMLEQDSTTLTTEYIVENIGPGAFPYIFGVHPSVCITEDTQILVPQGRYKTGFLYPPSLTQEKTFDWPCLEKMDLSHAYTFSNNLCVNFYTESVQQGSYGFFHKSRGCGMEIRSSPEDFPCLSLWLIYGGWRGHYCVMSEAFTCWPAVLTEAIKLKMHQTLQPSRKKTYVVYYDLLG